MWLGIGWCPSGKVENPLWRQHVNAASCCDGRSNTPQRGQEIRIFRVKTGCRPCMKKQHARVKNISFPLETRFFSSSIRNARGEAVLRW
jgi:hypothetical protein